MKLRRAQLQQTQNLFQLESLYSMVAKLFPWFSEAYSLMKNSKFSWKYHNLFQSVAFNELVYQHDIVMLNHDMTGMLSQVTTSHSNMIHSCWFKMTISCFFNICNYVLLSWCKFVPVFKTLVMLNQSFPSNIFYFLSVTTPKFFKFTQKIQIGCKYKSMARTLK